MSVRCLLSSLCVLFAFCFAASLPAQDLRYMHPEKYERATKADESGLVQWDAHKEDKCLTCAGTGKMKCKTCERFFEDATKCIDCKRNEQRETVCHACAGLGHFADPLEQALCASCQGAGFLECGLCSGGGRVKGGESERWSTCPACRGDGGWKCQGCDGKRLVAVAQLKPSLKEANEATLTKALATTDEALTALTTWSPAEFPNSRKAVKDLLKQMKIAEKVYPPLKAAQKALDDGMKQTYGGTQFQNQDERESAMMGKVKNSAEFYLKHQKRMIELALKRQEANAKIEAENKGK